MRKILKCIVKILLFLGLKVIEIGGAILAYYLLCLLGSYILNMNNAFWASGIVLFCLTFVIILVISIAFYATHAFIKFNIKLTSKLYEKLSKLKIKY